MTEPTLAEIFRVHADNVKRDLFTAFVGKVEKYIPGPPGPPVVDVLPVIKRALRTKNGELVHEDLPVVQNVPVVFPNSSGFKATWPISIGDFVLCLCANWSHQQWRETGSVSDPGDLRTHELNNAFAIAGVLSKFGTMPTNSNAAVFEVGGSVTHIQVGASATDFVAMNQKVLDELSSIATALSSHTHTATGCQGAASNSTYAAPSDVAATKLKSE